MPFHMQWHGINRVQRRAGELTSQPRSGLSMFLIVKIPQDFLICVKGQSMSTKQRSMRIDAIDLGKRDDVHVANDCFASIPV